MVIIPEEYFADFGVSIKVFMPFLYDKLLVFDCEVFCLRKLARLHADRLAQNDIALNDKYSFSVPELHMDVDWGVVVAVEEESESVFGEYSRHGIFSR